MPLGLKRQLHTTIRRVQSLRDIRDQVGRVLDANRQPDRRVENPYAGWQAGMRLGAAEAHSELEYLQRVEKFESSGLGAYDVERERGARAGALPLEQKAGGRVLVEVSKVLDLGHLGVVAQVIRHEPRIASAFSMPMFDVFSERLSIQQEWGANWVPMAPRNALMSFMRPFEPSAAPAMRSE